MTARITAAWRVMAGTAWEGELDVTGMSPSQIAATVEAMHPSISLCHQCAREVSDPEVGGLVEVSVDGVAYERAAGDQWVEVSSS